MKDVFREEALAHHIGIDADGDTLLRLPRWTQWIYRLLITVVITAFAFAALAFIPEYAEGPALIRAQRRTAVTAASPGVVAAIGVTRGARVEAGDILLRLRSVEEDAEIFSLQSEFDAALVRMLANPLDQSARQTMSGLRARRDILAAHLEERLVRAPVSGRVGEIRARIGQNMGPGELVASIAGDDVRFDVLALLPGHRRPALLEGQQLRIELAGYEYAYQTVLIDQVDGEILGPAEVRRVLGPEVSDLIQISGPVVVVHGRLPDTMFTSAGTKYAYFDGMLATARTQVRSERLLTNLVPGLKLLQHFTP